MHLTISRFHKVLWYASDLRRPDCSFLSFLLMWHNWGRFAAIFIFGEIPTPLYLSLSFSQICNLMLPHAILLPVGSCAAWRGGGLIPSPVRVAIYKWLKLFTCWTGYFPVLWTKGLHLVSDISSACPAAPVAPRFVAVELRGQNINSNWQSHEYCMHDTYNLLSNKSYFSIIHS